MDLEIVDAHLRTRGVELARAVGALDAGVVHEFDVIRGGGIGADGDGEVGFVADGGVSHRAFEGVVGVAFLEAPQGVREPGWGFRLGWKTFSYEVNNIGVRVGNQGR